MLFHSVVRGGFSSSCPSVLDPIFFVTKGGHSCISETFLDGIVVLFWTRGAGILVLSAVAGRVFEVVTAVGSCGTILVSVWVFWVVRVLWDDKAFEYGVPLGEDVSGVVVGGVVGGKVGSRDGATT